MRWLAAACASLLSWAAPASAATITVSFTGTVNFVFDQLDSAFTLGDPVSGTFQYDSDTADTVPADPVLGIYPGATNFEFDFGGYVATGNAPGSGVQVDNDRMATGLFDRFIGSKTCNGTCTGADVGAFTLQNLTFLLSGPATIFSSDALPTSLDLTDFSQRSASLEFSDGATGPQVTALIESLTVTVPEPGALALLVLGAGLVAVRRRASGAPSAPGA
jgi:hypothetical protein